MSERNLPEQAQANHRTKLFLLQVKNKWMVDQGDKITGLVHPETREEAQQEMERLGITGTLHARSEFEHSQRYKQFIRLPEEKDKLRGAALTGLQRDVFGRPLESDIPRVQALLDAADRLTIDDI